MSSDLYARSRHLLLQLWQLRSLQELGHLKQKKFVAALQKMLRTLVSEILQLIVHKNDSCLIIGICIHKANQNAFKE